MELNMAEYIFKKIIKISVVADSQDEAYEIAEIENDGSVIDVELIDIYGDTDEALGL
jgi:hypothetical protein